MVYNVLKKRYLMQDIVVADTIGLCDTDWDDGAIVNMIKGRVSSNFKFIDAVYIVFRADRLTKEHVANIKKLLQWLKYKKNCTGNDNTRFLFVGTYADYLDTDQKAKLRIEAQDMFEIGTIARFFIHNGLKYESLVYVGFPPEDTLNDLTRKRLKESWENLIMLLKIPEYTNRIAIDNQNLCSLI